METCQPSPALGSPVRQPLRKAESPSERFRVLPPASLRPELKPKSWVSSCFSFSCLSRDPPRGPARPRLSWVFFWKSEETPSVCSRSVCHGHPRGALIPKMPPALVSRALSPQGLRVAQARVGLWPQRFLEKHSQDQSFPNSSNSSFLSSWEALVPQRKTERGP